MQIEAGSTLFYHRYPPLQRNVKGSLRRLRLGLIPSSRAPPPLTSLPLRISSNQGEPPPVWTPPRPFTLSFIKLFHVFFGDPFFFLFSLSERLLLPVDVPDPRPGQKFMFVIFWIFAWQILGVRLAKTHEKFFRKIVDFVSVVLYIIYRHKEHKQHKKGDEGGIIMNEEQKKQKELREAEIEKVIDELDDEDAIPIEIADEDFPF
jgi:hypothetical protein